MGRRVTSVTGNTARQTRGFTLLELLVVLTLLVLLAAAWPLAGSRLLPAQALRNEAASLYATVRLARSDALVHDSSTVVTVLDDGRGYRYGTTDHRLSSGVRLTLDPAGSGTLTFFPDGSSTGGHLILRSGARASEVTVGPLTGRVQREL